MRLSLGLLVVLAFGPHATPADPVKSQSGEAKPQPFIGKVMPLGKALEKLGAKNDADATGIALVTDDGTIYTLVKDDVSRLLFLDKQFQDRQVQLTANRLAGTQILQVTTVQTLKDGKLHDVFYWCENCQLAATEPGPCKCCGAETALFEAPVKAK